MQDVTNEVSEIVILLLIYLIKESTCMIKSGKKEVIKKIVPYVLIVTIFVVECVIAYTNHITIN